jgi:hypothetical protein
VAKEYFLENKEDLKINHKRAPNFEERTLNGRCKYSHPFLPSVLPKLSETEDTTILEIRGYTYDQKEPRKECLKIIYLNLKRK